MADEPALPVITHNKRAAGCDAANPGDRHHGGWNDVDCGTCLERRPAYLDRPGGRYPLERPYTRRKLIRRLALTDVGDDEVCADYGVDDASIHRFRKRHAEEIAAVAANAADEFAGLWIAEKLNRLTVYGDMLEQALAKGELQNAARILRNAAEEMGHLPSRVQISGDIGVHTSYSIIDEDGKAVDLKDLT